MADQVLERERPQHAPGRVADETLQLRRAVVRRSARRSGGLDAFPHTRRPLPWLLAAFVVMVFTVPIDQVNLDVHLPFNSQIDRFFVAFMVLAWLVLGGDQRTLGRSRRSKLFVHAAVGFVIVAVASLLLDSARIINLNEWTLAQKQIALLVSFLAIAGFSLTALRFEDMHGFVSLVIGLSTIMAIGVLIERRTGFNVFYWASGKVLSPIATVASPDTSINLAASSDDRVVVLGPTATGLACAAMLCMMLPFPLARLIGAETRRDWWKYATISAFVLAAAMATDKKSTLILPAVVVIYFAVYRPRMLVRLIPLGIAMIGFVHVVAPDTLGTVLSPGQWFNSNSTTHRTTDLQSIMPDILAHPIFGRGFGSLDTTAADQFRILDDEFLDMIWQSGVLGIAAYAWLILAPVVGARKSIRSRIPDVSLMTLAASASCLVFFAASAIFDTLSFDQTPYLFFVVASFCVVLSDPVAAGRVVRQRARAAPATVVRAVPA